MGESIRLLRASCPTCAAGLDLEDGRDTVRCRACGNLYVTEGVGERSASAVLVAVPAPRSRRPLALAAVAGGTILAVGVAHLAFVPTLLGFGVLAGTLLVRPAA